MRLARNLLAAFVLVALTLTLTGGITSSANASSKPSKTVLTRTAKNNLYGKLTPMVYKAYNKKLRSHNETYLNWGFDGCSVPKALPSYYSATFLNACIRHDFGYRNFGKAHASSKKLIPTRGMKDSIDWNFRLDMLAECKNAKLRPKGDSLKTCNKRAGQFYTAVNHLGDDSFFGKDKHK